MFKVLSLRMRIFLLQTISALSIGISAPAVSMAAAPSNAISKDSVALNYQAKDNCYTVRFSTTLPSANSTVQILSTQTAQSQNWTTGISFSTSPSATLGGRASTTFQIVGATGKIHVDFTSADISTNTSPYREQGDWFSPDNPDAYQGNIFVKGESTATITGWIKFDRPWCQ